MTAFRHVALLVPDVRAAEEYYSALFAMDLLFREGPATAGLDAGEWATLRPGVSWEQADTAGLTIGMVALRRDDVVLALFPGPASGAQVYAIGLVIAPDEIDAIRSSLPDDSVVEDDAPGWLSFVDRFGLRWQLAATSEFRSAGERDGRWLNAK